ncbi:MAG: hypothetical protein D6729_18425 [Deltaproteobacteria bacterium]|nr:MAG: hypothetical protein D6729_18425 [Deltaproteobacteria bacterium]
MKHVYLLVCGLGFALCACGGVGGASTEGSIGPWRLDVGGTVFTIHDATEYVQDSGVFTKKAREPELVRIYMSGAHFDPRQDMRFLSLEERIRISDELQKRGYVMITFADASKIATDTAFQSDETGSDRDNGVTMLWNAGIQKLSSDAKFPDKIPPMASQQSWTLSLREARLEEGGVVAGTLEITRTRGSFDPESAPEGSFTIDFVAPVIPERVAECNEATGWGLQVDVEAPACAPF